jgi:hypothetical protein
MVSEMDFGFCRRVSRENIFHVLSAFGFTPLVVASQPIKSHKPPRCFIQINVVIDNSEIN